MDNFRKKENRVDYARRRSETPVTVIFQLRSGFAPSREDCTFPPVGKYIYIFYIVEKKVSFNLAGVHSIKRTGEGGGRGKIANVLANKSNSAKE